MRARHFRRRRVSVCGKVMHPNNPPMCCLSITEMMGVRNSFGSITDGSDGNQSVSIGERHRSPSASDK